ncbi:MAG: chitobiase/beta-hexosaminidase C-terminal domain-containing protein [Oscillospiraceae bacterium]|nr:chitobiase/beta-hexosaminidase C-terminal domain-containing protein [Oscillospiraceae bacterium]
MKKRIISLAIAASMIFSLIPYVSSEEIMPDYSEWNMTTNTSVCDPDGFDFNTVTRAGNIRIASAYLARWDGVVNEEDDPDPEKGVNMEDYYNELPSSGHVQNILTIPDRADSLDNNGIKEAVMKYGALYTSYRSNSAFYGSNHITYYHPEDSEETLSTGWTAVIGWDDNYPADNFVVTPPGNGAFLCKGNSGTSYGQDGYFYVSYYDEYICRCSDNTVFTGVESDTNYNKIYQYDTFGYVGIVNYNNDTIYAANVFPEKGGGIEDDELIEAVSFYTVNPDVEYSVYIIPYYTDMDDLSSFRMEAASGVLEYCGYHTIELDEAVKLKAGSRFAVIVKLTSRDGSNVDFCIEYPKENYSSRARANIGESFVSRYGNKSWLDYAEYRENVNVCIKAFTNNGKKSARLFSGTGNSVPESDKVYSLEEAYELGMMTDYDHALYSGEITEPENSSDSVSLYEDKEYPAVYDLRDYGYVTPVKSSNGRTNGWAYAVYSALESSELKKRDERNKTLNQPQITVTDIYGGKSVSILSDTEDAEIYYTIDGSEPTHQSALYEGEISFISRGSVKIKAIAVKKGYTDSPPAQCEVLIDTIKPPAASKESGNIYEPMEVRLEAENGADIYYTTDGTVPSADSNKYTDPVTIDGTVTLQATAVTYGFAQSNIVRYDYKYIDPDIGLVRIELLPHKNVTQNSAEFSAVITDDGGNEIISGRFEYYAKNNSAAKYIIAADEDFKAIPKNLAPDTEY